MRNVWHNDVCLLRVFIEGFNLSVLKISFRVPSISRPDSHQVSFDKHFTNIAKE